MGGNVLRGPWRHQHRASSRREAKFVSISAETAAALALSVDNIADHHSDGIQSRCHHLVTIPADAPISEAIAKRAPWASLGPQSSMTERNDVICDMSSPLGQSVLNCKDFSSLDKIHPLGQDVPMGKATKKPLSDYELGFMARTWAAREAKGWTQKLMGEKLGGLSQDTYKQYETRGMLPRPLISSFLTLTEISFEYLFDGKADGPAWRERFRDLLNKQPIGKRSKKAA